MLLSLALPPRELDLWPLLEPVALTGLLELEPLLLRMLWEVDEDEEEEDVGRLWLELSDLLP